MSIVVERATVPCGVCGARVTELRRGRCWGCYTQWVELRPVGRGAACKICNERRREQLRMVEVHNRSLPMCHGCASRTLKLSPIPETLEALRRMLNRDRRSIDRRGDGMDRRIFPRERRVGQRRGLPRASSRCDTDPAIMLPDFDDLVIEIDENDLEILETTVVKERPKR